MKEIYMDRVKIALNSKGPVNSSRKRFGKIAFTLTLVLLSFANSFSQCTWYTANTACTSNAPTVVGTSVSCTPPNNNGGRRNFVINNMTAGCTYRISNCGSGFDTQMTIRNSAGTVVGYNDDNGPACSGSASSIDFLCTATGQYWIQMNRYNCSTTNALNGTITVTLQGCTAPLVGCTSTSSWGSGTAPTASAPNTSLTTCAYAGDYSTINSVAASTNYISTATGGASNYITIRLGSTTGTLIAQGNSPLSWTSTTAGTYFQILNTNSTCGTDASCHTQMVSVPCTPSGNPATYGTNAWIGYVYDAATPGAFTTYKGFVNEATTFDRTHTTIAAGATASHCSQNQDLFTIRYRNTANLAAGYYTFSVGGDDGVRFSIDGGATWLINNWVDQSYTVSTNPTPVYLSGNTNMVLEYYENTGGSRSSFSYIFTPACAGTPTPGNTIASVTSVVSGGTSNLSLQNATTPATYQWQSSSSSTGPWANIGGATSATYTATVTANTYYQCVVTCTASSTSAASTPVQITLITPPVNDACANATALPCGTSALAGTTVNAVSETSPLSYSSPFGVWYTFTGDGNSTTITANAAWDHEVLVFTGTTCGGAYSYVANADANSSGNESVTFTTVNGTTYFVYVAHWSTASTTTGAFTISRTCTAPPWKSLWVSMNTGSSTWCIGETRTISVTLTNNGSATWTNTSPDINIGVKWNAEADYFVRTDANGLAPGVTQTYNLTVTAPSIVGSNNLSFDVVNEGNFWFANNASGVGPGNIVYVSPAVSIIDCACSGTPTPGNTVASVTSVASGGTSNLSLQNLTSGNGVTYQWQSASSSTGPWVNIGGANTSTYVATVTSPTWYKCIVSCTASSTSAISNPVQITLLNDNCSDAFAMACGSTVTVNTVGAATDAIGSTSCGTTITTPGVWYQIAGNGDQMTVSTVGLTSADTKIIVYSGSCSGLTCIGGSDDFSGVQSSVSWNSVAGTNYYVLTALYSGTGTFPMSLTCVAPPANDNCSNAEAITIQCPTSPTAVAGNTLNATEQATIADPTCDGGTIRDVWYSFNSGSVSSVNLTVTLGTATWLGGQLFTACGTEATGLVMGGNAGSCDYNLSTPSPTIISGLQPNTNYLLRLFNNVDWDTPGTFTFTLTTDSPTASITSVASTICQGNQVNLSGTVVASGSWTINLNNGQSTTGSGNASWTITASPTSTTTYTISSLSGTYCPAVLTGSTTITLPTAGSALAQDNESATCTVNQNGWVHFYHSSGRLIASVNSQGQNLGAVTATSYVEGAPISVDACTSSNPIYTTTVLGRHWVITPTNQPTSAVYVRLPYENTEFSNLTSAASTNANTNDDLLSPTDLGLSKYSNGTNTNVNDVATDNCGVGTTTFHTPIGNGASTVYSSVNASYSDFSIPGFSEFWLHGSAQSSPLPVELLSFQANCQEEGNVNVTWTTASEHNSANFTVEKSRDGMNWTVLAALAGAGNSNQLINYSTIDNNPVGGVNYYRLTQIDFDGASETFNIASANCGDNSSLTTVKVYPNPSAGDFYIDFTSEEIIGSSVITIADARGMEVYSMNVEVEKGSNVFHIENLEVAPGMYYIKVSNGALTSSIVKHSLR